MNNYSVYHRGDFYDHFNTLNEARKEVIELMWSAVEDQVNTVGYDSQTIPEDFVIKDEDKGIELDNDLTAEEIEEYEREYINRLDDQNDHMTPSEFKSFADPDL